jgi:hypothetical protein
LLAVAAALTALTLLSLLTTLTLLSLALLVTRLLAGLTLFTLLALAGLLISLTALALTLTLLLSLAATRHPLELFSHPLDLVQRAFDTFVLPGFVAVADGRLRLFHLIAQLFETLCYRPFARREVRTITLANVIGAELHAYFQLVLLHVPERFPKFAGCASLCPGQIANGTLHVLFETVQLVEHAFTLSGKRFGLLPALARL